MIKKFIILIIFISFSNILYAENNRYFNFDKGIVPLIYHRFDEKKYPSTNIDIDVFKEQMKTISNNNYRYFNPKNFKDFFQNPSKEKNILVTIDDGFSSFYKNAWPYLKKNKIPFILFVSTEPIGKYGYMNWEQIKEIEKEDFAFIGNHSHSHEYLINYNLDNFKKDITTSIKIFKEKLGYNPIFFSYPFGEYSLQQKNYIKKKFQYSFGQHSGVIDLTKDKFELPRFPINEKYGDIKRFKFLIDLLPLPYEKLTPEEKFISSQNNPPNIMIKFFSNQKNLNNINCFSNEGNNWKKSKLIFDDKKLTIKLSEKFIPRRGRVNCSLNDTKGWRWFGLQFTIN